MRIRQADLIDAAQLLAIYQPYVEQTTITFEYLVPSIKEFEERMRQTLLEYPFLVAETNEGQIIGYCYAGAYKTRQAYDWTVETTVYVQQDCPIKGVGTALYKALENILQQQNVCQLLACITAGNEGSLSFHEKMGYREIGRFIKVGYKMDQWCDVIWMQKELASLPQVPIDRMKFSELSDD